MTLAGEQTSIDVTSVESMRNFTFLCRHKIQLFQVDVEFVDEQNYDAFMQTLLQSFKLQHFKVCFIYLMLTIYSFYLEIRFINILCLSYNL